MLGDAARLMSFSTARPALPIMQGSYKVIPPSTDVLVGPAAQALPMASLYQQSIMLTCYLMTGILMKVMLELRNAVPYLLLNVI